MVTEFLTTTLLGGIIYDLMKIGVSNSYELAKKSLKEYTSSEKDIRQLKSLLDKDILTKENLTKENIIEILENSEEISFLVKKVKKIDIKYAEQIIIQQSDKKKELPIIDEVFELDTKYNSKAFGLIFIITFLSVSLIHWYCIFICPIIGFIFWLGFESKFKEFIEVHNNKLVFNDESISYSSISDCQKLDDLYMILELYNTGRKEEKLFLFYREDEINFIKNSIKLYQKYND